MISSGRINKCGWWLLHLLQNEPYLLAVCFGQVSDSCYVQVSDTRFLMREISAEVKNTKSPKMSQV